MCTIFEPALGRLPRFVSVWIETHLCILRFVKQSTYTEEELKTTWFETLRGRRGGLMVSALDSGASAPGSSPGRGHCIVFLGKTLYCHSAFLHPGVQMGTSELLGKT